jgi:hypothetical protein
MHQSRSANRPFRRTCSERPTPDAEPDLTARRHLHRWVLNLPWVIERPSAICAPGVRWFAVDCASLAVRRIWLLTGPLDSDGCRCDINLVVPEARLDAVLAMTEVQVSAQIGQGHHLVTVHGGIARWPDDQLETLVRSAYDSTFW